MKNVFTALFATCLVVFVSSEVLAQTPATVEIEPSTLELKVGDTIQLKGVDKDADGNAIPDAQVLFFGSRIDLTVTPGGLVTAIQPEDTR